MTPRKTVKPSGGRRGKAADAKTAMAKRVGLSHPDKALWPDGGDGKPVTKLDLACYLEVVGEWMLPHIVGRPCSLVRAPDGVADTYDALGDVAGGQLDLGSVRELDHLRPGDGAARDSSRPGSPRRRCPAGRAAWAPCRRAAPARVRGPR